MTKEDHDLHSARPSGDSRDTSYPSTPWILSRNETVSSFLNWHSNIEQHLSLHREFISFLNFEWAEKAVVNRGFEDDEAPVKKERWKSAAQKNAIVEQMLEFVAQFSPSVLRHDIVTRSTSMRWIWDYIRNHYSFPPSERNFLDLHRIHRHETESYQSFFRRIINHLKDNLLTATSSIMHNGGQCKVNEELSPTTERLAVYLWLTLIDPRLPAYISKTYARQLQTKSLKYIQPQLSDSMDSLLQNMKAGDSAQILHCQSARRGGSNPRVLKKDDNLFLNLLESDKTCAECKSVGRPYFGHTSHSCWNIEKLERFDAGCFPLRGPADDLIARVPPDKTTDDINESEFSLKETSSDFDYLDKEIKKKIRNTTGTQPPGKTSGCGMLSLFYAFYKHHPCLVMLDISARSNLVSKSFLKLTGIDLNPLQNSTDGTNEDRESNSGYNFPLNIANKDLSISASLADSLDSDVLLNNSFCIQNDIKIQHDLEGISFRGLFVPFNSQLGNTEHGASEETLLLRNDKRKVVLPGDFLDVHNNVLAAYEGEVAVEPCLNSPMNSHWPYPHISRVIQGTLRIPNTTHYPIQLDEGRQFAQIRRVKVPEHSRAEEMFEDNSIATHSSRLHSELESANAYSVTVDPDNILTRTEKLKFADINKHFDPVFSNIFTAYNSYSGSVQTNINLEDGEPPIRIGKVPSYCNSDLQLLQKEMDKLEMLGVLAKPEDFGIQVKHVSPSFLVKNDSDGHGIVTTFTELRQYSRCHRSVFSSSSDVLRKLSSWEYIIKTDLTQLLYQIPVAMSSVPFLGTVTPFKGLRVYLRTTTGIPGSTESLEKLTSDVLGDMVKEGVVLIIANTLYVCGNYIAELCHYWRKLLQRLHANNLNLLPTKTVICPKQTNVLGWVWNAGTLTLNPVNITPLITVGPPETYQSMFSFIRTFKSISRCVRNCASLLSPLEDATKEVKGTTSINWTQELKKSFKIIQETLQCPLTLTIPRPSDRLVMTIDAPLTNKALGVTLSIDRGAFQQNAEFFSFKLKSYQLTWSPCEHEALAIANGIEYFSKYLKLATYPLFVKTDYRSCAQAFTNLRRGMFFVSAKISAFLSTISSHRVTIVHHSKRTWNRTDNFDVQELTVCASEKCDICKLASQESLSVIESVTVPDILSGTANMPFLGSSTWRRTQHECPQLRRACAHLMLGTYPSKNARNLKALRRYIKIASVNDEGLLVVKDTDRSGHEIIVVPAFVLPGLLTALHVRLSHPSEQELNKLFWRYFYALNSIIIAKQVFESCNHCNPIHSPLDDAQTSSQRWNKPRSSNNTREFLPSITTSFKLQNQYDFYSLKHPELLRTTSVYDDDVIGRYLVPSISPGTDCGKILQQNEGFHNRENTNESLRIKEYNYIKSATMNMNNCDVDDYNINNNQDDVNSDDGDKGDGDNVDNVDDDDDGDDDDSDDDDDDNADDDNDDDVDSSDVDDEKEEEEDEDDDENRKELDDDNDDITEGRKKEKKDKWERKEIRDNSEDKVKSSWKKWTSSERPSWLTHRSASWIRI